jgi:tetratricopeptide (TPR) repeat protein
VHNELANVLHDRGRVADALPHYREALRAQGRSSGTRTINYAVKLNNLATALEDLGQVSEAAGAYRESLEIRQALLPAGDLGTARARHNLGRFLLRGGQVTAARPLIESAAADRAARLAPTHRDRLETTLAQAELALLLADPGAAQARLDELAPHLQALGPSRAVQHGRLSAELAALRGQRDLALQRADAAWRRAQADLYPGHPERQRAQLLLARLSLQAGDRPRARNLVQALQAELLAQEPAAPLRQQAQGLKQRLDIVAAQR